VTSAELEDLLRQLTPQVLGALVRRFGHFDVAEDAVQEALLGAAVQWPRDGLPQNPKGWLIAVAGRRLTDLLRSEQSRRRREGTVGPFALTEGQPDPAGEPRLSDSDDSLILLFLCCHPALPVTSQIGLTLRAVAGLSTAEIARALLVSEAAVTRRITRAKRSIKASGIPFAIPASASAGDRLDAVLRVLYLVFNEGYASTAGPDLQRTELNTEAIRLARMVHRALPTDCEVTGLLALMLLIHARHRARTAPDGTLIPMAQQDRDRWDTDAITEGIVLISDVLPRGQIGPYQLQAAIAAIHDEAPTADATDWPQIVALYEVLLQIDPSPVVALNHAVAVAMAGDPGAGLRLLAALDNDPRVNNDRRLHAVRAHLLEMTGDQHGAHACYQAAAQNATNLQQQRYLHVQIARLAPPNK
jgi:RNA polymerase sigma factor (sigma-70 family)